MAGLWANFQGPAKQVVRNVYEGFERLLSILREKPSRINAGGLMHTRRYKRTIKSDERPGEVIGDYFVRDQRAFREMTKKLEHDVAVTSSLWKFIGPSRMLNTRWSRMRTFSQRHRGNKKQTGQTLFELEIRGYRLLQNCTSSHEKSDRWFLLDNKKRHGVHSYCNTAA